MSIGNIFCANSFENVCRTCFSKEDATHNINKIIINMIMEVADVKVENNDGLPSKMCTDCNRELNAAFQFRIQCRKIDEQLRNIHYIAKYNIDNETKEEKLFSYKHERKDSCLSDTSTYKLGSIDDSTHSNENINYIFGANKAEMDSAEQSFDDSSEEKKLLINDSKSHDINNSSVCALCNIQVKKLRHHIQTVHSSNNITYTCEICNAKLTRKSTYKKHMKIHTGDKRYKCEYCDKSFIQSHHLKNHLIVHTKESPYNCKFCDRSFKRSESLTRHKKTVHHDSSYNHVCKLCGEAFDTVKGLNSHSRSHLKIGKFSCEICPQVYLTANKLQEHKIHHEYKKKHNITNEFFPCVECNKLFKQFSSLVAHKKLHSGSPQLCQYCGKIFSNNYYLTCHVRTHTQEKPFSCDKCPSTFITKSSLIRHKTAVHLQERPHGCKTCLKTFAQLSHLKRHMRTHTGEKPYICLVCNKCFAEKTNLTVHKRMHSRETPYHCPLCNKGFYDSSSMKKHHKKHLCK